MDKTTLEYIKLNYMHLSAYSDEQKEKLNLLNRVSSYLNILEFYQEHISRNKVEQNIIKGLMEELKETYNLSDTDIQTYRNNHLDIKEQMRNTKAIDIYNQYRDEIFFNKCPICGCLARTPKAKQARCGHRWE